MPIVEEEVAGGVIRRKFVVRTTAERRRDRRVRAEMRKWKIGIDPDIYARVWAATAGVSDPEAVALVYQAELARAALVQAYGHRPEALALAARQINRAAKVLEPASPQPMLALVGSDPTGKNIAPQWTPGAARSRRFGIVCGPRAENERLTERGQRARTAALNRSKS